MPLTKALIINTDAIIPIPIPMGPFGSLYDEAAKRLLPLLQPAP